MNSTTFALAVALAAVAIILALQSDRAVPPATPQRDATPAAELATGPPVTRTRLRQALAIAQAYWTTRCNTSPRLERLPFPRRKTIAMTSWLRHSDGRYSACVVTFNSRHRKLAFGLYCAAMVHELGHLSGRKHSRNPRSVMYRIVSKANVPRVCKLTRDSDLVGD